LTSSILSILSDVDLDDIVAEHLTYDSTGYVLIHNDRPW
jgi:hypothetical protein